MPIEHGHFYREGKVADPDRQCGIHGTQLSKVSIGITTPFSSHPWLCSVNYSNDNSQTVTHCGPQTMTTALENKRGKQASEGKAKHARGGISATGRQWLGPTFGIGSTTTSCKKYSSVWPEINSLSIVPLTIVCTWILLVWH